MAEKIMLIDGNSIVNRAFYGVPLLTNGEGRYTNGVYGFLNILFKLLDEEQPDYLAVAFDLHAPTFRHRTFDGYKGTRKGMPEELREQMPLLKEVLQTMHIPIFEQEGFEADDILGTLSALAEKNGITLEAEGDGIMTGSDALIYRLIFNLTENAVKYNRPGGSVRVSVTQELEKLLLRVSDTGCGIPEVYQRSIFQPFFRVDKSRSREYGGAGLGLSLVWEIADLHGGSVWVEKSSEKGTTIAVGLPTQQSTKP